MNKKALAADEPEMFALFELTPDLVCLAGRDGYFKKINPAVSNTLGYTPEELFSKPIFFFLHPDDREHTGREREKLLNGKPMLNLQNRYCTKAGGIVWLEWTSVYVPARDVVFAIAKNITTRKQIENEITEQYQKFKGLTAHFKNTIEQDRKFLAMELHEQLAQLASVIRLDLGSIREALPGVSEAVSGMLDHARTASDLLIHTIRRLSFAISPTMLDDVGLHDVMQWLCREFSAITRIPCHYDQAVDERRLPRDIQLDLFRICQEWLTNTLYHSAAGKITICIEELDNTIHLTIINEGNDANLQTGWELPGLTSIRQRVASINGRLVVNMEPGKQTRICVMIGRE